MIIDLDGEKKALFLMNVPYLKCPLDDGVVKHLNISLI